MLHRASTKIQRSMISQTSEQLGYNSNFSGKSGVVKTQLKKQRTGNYKYNQSGQNSEDI